MRVPETRPYLKLNFHGLLVGVPSSALSPPKRSRSSPTVTWQDPIDGRARSASRLKVAPSRVDTTDPRAFPPPDRTRPRVGCVEKPAR